MKTSRKLRPAFEEEQRVDAPDERRRQRVQPGESEVTDEDAGGSPAGVARRRTRSKPGTRVRPTRCGDSRRASPCRSRDRRPRAVASGTATEHPTGSAAIAPASRGSGDLPGRDGTRTRSPSPATGRDGVPPRAAILDDLCTARRESSEEIRIDALGERRPRPAPHRGACDDRHRDREITLGEFCSRRPRGRVRGRRARTVPETARTARTGTSARATRSIRCPPSTMSAARAARLQPVTRGHAVLGDHRRDRRRLGRVHAHDRRRLPPMPEHAASRPLPPSRERSRAEVPPSPRPRRRGRCRPWPWPCARRARPPPDRRRRRPVRRSSRRAARPGPLAGRCDGRRSA